MAAAPKPDNETQRLTELYALKLLDSGPDQAFDRITELGRDLFQVPVALVSLVDANRQWFKSCAGLGLDETPREQSFCAYTLGDAEPLFIEDASLDPRFADNPLVTGEPRIRAYAGWPLTLGSDLVLGTYCLVDTQPRIWTAQERRWLKGLAGQVEELIRLHAARERLQEEHDAARMINIRHAALLDDSAAGILRINEQGRIQAINPAALAMLGYEQDEVLGRNVSMLMPARYAEHHNGFLQRYLETGEKRIIGTGREVEACHRDGHEIPVHLAVSEVEGPDGSREFLGVLTDLSRVHAASRAAERERALLSSVLAGSPNPIYARDTQGQYVLANDACARVLGVAPGDLEGQRPRDIFPKRVTRITGAVDERVMGTGQPESVVVNPLEDDENTRFELAKSPLYDAQGNVNGVVTVAHDISDLWRATRDLQARKSVLELSQRFARAVPWVLNLDSGYITWLNEGEAVLAREIDGQEQTVDSLLERVPEADRGAIRAALQGVVERGERFAVEHRFVLDDGREIWVAVDGNRIEGGAEESARIVGMAQDRTGEKQRALAAERQRRLLKVLHQGLTDYQALLSGNQLWRFLLDALLDLTDSGQAFIGEVLETDQGPELKINAITDMTWDDASRDLLARLEEGGMRLGRADTLLGRSFAKGEVVISRDPAGDPRGAGLPPGHPPLDNYLGVPILSDGVVIGMYAIANGQHGYSEETVEWLKPFTAACALLINLRRQLDEREQVTRELAEARDQAERANRAKTDFLSAMSHELRTPLNAILGFSQLLQNSRRQPLPDGQREQVRQIHSSGKYLLELINDVLDLARVESGRMQVSLEPVSVADVAREALDTIAGVAGASTVSVEPPADLTDWPTVRADYTRLKQMLLNLLSNAIKYNREHGRVWLTWERWQDGQSVIAVNDTGPGVPDAREAELFQPFSRLDADQAGIEGTGIGLALTQRLAEQMGGAVGYRRREPDGTVEGGSTFWIRLPEDEPQSHAESSESCAAVDDRREARSCARRRRKVLYVEDNPANQQLLRAVCDELPNVEVTCVPSAELGIEWAFSEQPDLVLMDIDLPGMDGFEALQVLSRHAATRHIPVVALSAYALRSQIRQGLDAGFREYLTKPLDMARLRQILEEWCT